MTYAPQPCTEKISVERLERCDGALIIYVDAIDVVVFIYIGSDDDPAAVVVDIHRRSDLGEERLEVLLDGVRIRPLTIDPTRFHLLLSANATGDVELRCIRCHVPLCGIGHALALQQLLDRRRGLP